jgi:hypothetical protein
MERTWVTQADLDDPDIRVLTTQTTKDQYLDRVAKMIPAEVIALYLFLDGMFKSLPVKPDPLPPTDKTVYPPTELLIWVTFLIFIPLCAAYMIRVARVKKNRQVVETVLAFVAWVAGVGGPFILWDWWFPAYGAAIVALYSFVVPMVDRNAGRWRAP